MIERLRYGKPHDRAGRRCAVTTTDDDTNDCLAAPFGQAVSQWGGRARRLTMGITGLYSADIY